MPQRNGAPWATRPAGDSTSASAGSELARGGWSPDTSGYSGDGVTRESNTGAIRVVVLVESLDRPGMGEGLLRGSTPPMRSSSRRWCRLRACSPRWPPRPNASRIWHTGSMSGSTEGSSVPQRPCATPTCQRSRSGPTTARGYWPSRRGRVVPAGRPNGLGGSASAPRRVGACSPGRWPAGERAEPLLGAARRTGTANTAVVAVEDGLTRVIAEDGGAVPIRSR